MTNYIQRYFMVAPETYYKLKELQMSKTSGDPPDIKVPKLIQEFTQEKMMQKNFQDEFLANTNTALQKLGVVNTPYMPQVPVASTPAPTPPSLPASTSGRRTSRALGSLGTSRSDPSRVAPSVRVFPSASKEKTSEPVFKDPVLPMPGTRAREAVVAPAPASVPEPSPPEYGTGNEASGGEDQLSAFLKWLKDEASSAQTGNKLQRLASTLHKLPNITIDARHIIVDGEKLDVSSWQILNNLVRADRQLISESVYQLLSQLYENQIGMKLIKVEVICNKEAIKFLRNPVDSSFGKRMLESIFGSDNPDLQEFDGIPDSQKRSKKGSGLSASNKSGPKLKGWTDMFKKTRGGQRQKQKKQKKKKMK